MPDQECHCDGFRETGGREGITAPLQVDHAIQFGEDAEVKTRDADDWDHTSPPDGDEGY